MFILILTLACATDASNIWLPWEENKKTIHQNTSIILQI